MTKKMGHKPRNQNTDHLQIPRQTEAHSSSDTFPDCDASQQPEYLHEATRTRDDGRIHVDLNSKLGQMLSRLVEIPIEEPGFEAPPAYTEVQPWTSRLNIVIQVVGSRGDVQPFIALGTQLQKQGHRVRLATHDTFKDFVLSSGLEFYPVGGDPAELMAYMVKNPGLIPNLNTLKKGEIQRKRKMIAQMLRGFWRSCISPDPETHRPFVANAIIANPPSFAHIHCAQALGCPLHLVFTMPWSPTRAFPHPLANLKYTTIEPRRANYLSYILVQVLTWQGLAHVINKFRRSIDLEDIPMTEAPMLAETLQIPYTYCWSPALVPKPKDWNAHIDVCGFLFRDAPNYTPPHDLACFLRAGPAPIYIGFGSIVVDDSEKMTSMLVQAVKACGVRAIISKGWSKLGRDIQEDGIFFLGDCPHEWLFQHVSAVVHHGGAGTTACGLANAKPTTIIPFFGDQPFWGNMVAAAGAGPTPIPYKQLSTENIAEAIRFCLTAESQAAARAMADKMRLETGVKTAVDSFHRNLSSETMACDVLPHYPAVWACIKEGRPFKLSGVVAQTLLDAGLIKQKDLAPYESKTTVIQNRRWDIVTSGSAVQLEITMNVINAFSHIWKAPRKVWKEQSKLTGEDIEQSSGKIAGQMAMSSAMFVPKVVSAFTKGMLVDTPLATAEGLRNMSALYGDRMADHRVIVDWKTGAIVAGEEMIGTFRKGLTDIFTMPVKGYKTEGAWGATKGLGMGISNSLFKTTSGAVGLFAYPAQGIYKSIYATAHSTTREIIVSARKAEDEWNIQHQQDQHDKLVIVNKFGTLLNEARMQRPNWFGKMSSSSRISATSLVNDTSSEVASDFTPTSRTVTSSPNLSSTAMMSLTPSIVTSQQVTGTSARDGDAPSPASDTRRSLDHFYNDFDEAALPVQDGFTVQTPQTEMASAPPVPTYESTAYRLPSFTSQARKRSR